MSKESLRDIIAQTFINALSEDKIPWRAMWTASLAHNAVNGKRYRGLNSLWLSYVASAKAVASENINFGISNEREVSALAR